MMAIATSTARAHDHPPYKEMIVSAIGSLKERKGSSKTAIGKYIATNYSDLPDTHDSLLGTHLHRLRTQGVVVMVKRSYKLAKPKPGSTSVAVSTEKRRPGRPPKKASDGEKRRAGRTPKKASDGEKRKPGRPPKASDGEKRKPGHPPKALGGDKRKPGRPPKALDGEKQTSGRPGKVLDGEKRKPGRPPKALDGEKRKPGRPAKVVDGEKRKPGRPPKVSAPSQQLETTAAAAVVLGKKRTPGRPRKLKPTVAPEDNRKPGSGGPENGEVASSGEKRKRGRPKKGTAPATSPVKEEDGDRPPKQRISDAAENTAGNTGDQE